MNKIISINGNSLQSSTFSFSETSEIKYLNYQNEILTITMKMKIIPADDDEYFYKVIRYLLTGGIDKKYDVTVIRFEYSEGNERRLESGINFLNIPESDVENYKIGGGQAEFCGTDNLGNTQKLKASELMSMIIYLAEHFFKLKSIRLGDGAVITSKNGIKEINATNLFIFTRRYLFYQKIDPRFSDERFGNVNIPKLISLCEIEKINVKDLIKGIRNEHNECDVKVIYLLELLLFKLELMKSHDDISFLDLMKAGYEGNDTQDIVDTLLEAIYSPQKINYHPCKDLNRIKKFLQIAHNEKFIIGLRIIF